MEGIFNNMKQNKIKYFGICATVLLTVAPMTSNVMSFIGQPVAPAVVKADAKTDYQSSLNDGFNTNVNVPISSIQNLKAFEGTSKGNSIIYDNHNPSDATKSLLKRNGVYEKLYDALNYSLLQLFVKNDATVKFLGNDSYKTAINVYGPRIQPGNGATSAYIIDQLRTLKVGDSFTVELTTTDGFSSIGSIKMTANIVNDSAKPTINPIPDLSVNNGDETHGT